MTVTGADESPLENITLHAGAVFPDAGHEPFFDAGGWHYPVSYFVGRNGSGKSRTARLVADQLGGRLLSTDRLAGLMAYTNYGWTSVPEQQGVQGIPLGEQQRSQARNFSRSSGSGIDEMYTLKEYPDVWPDSCHLVDRLVAARL